jgi:hypothetical protein
LRQGCTSESSNIGLSKYPHVRQAFYKSRFHPASGEFGGQQFEIGSGKRKGDVDKGLEKEKEKDKGVPPSTTTKETPGSSLKAFTDAASLLSLRLP